ncbi:uncharacterized protein UV8b_00468 [Ustilaginoidea virens]|uniref:Uncharacterized protein n=1 Tax=Ustilaginoidea virens TaxID=1159556 RepID=A0A8E5HJ49_USTVR|nr:uncharacterized protein UV8b_00468 [Ustilaginoidea virens]QUC16227.1 hypothetical protein UV8b_00468 [Ustilaginoidea virens]
MLVLQAQGCEAARLQGCKPPPHLIVRRQQTSTDLGRAALRPDFTHGHRYHLTSMATPKNRPRDPPPVLFLPPSPGASHVSLPSTAPPAPAPAPGQDALPPERDGRALSRTDALWAQMQAILEDVELAASSGGTHVFGPDHDLQLRRLRSAQIGLAQAWARNETDDLPAGSADEPEHDAVLGARRREANDRYFRRVNDGVSDVVAKLEQVAVAIRSVERESKDVWDESRTVDTVT